MNDHVILGVHITERIRNVPAVQELFTEFGADIKTRVGLHEVQGGKSSPNGLILLELVGGEAKADQLSAKLDAISGVYVKKMVFNHPG